MLCPRRSCSPDCCCGLSQLQLFLSIRLNTELGQLSPTQFPTLCWPSLARIRSSWTKNVWCYLRSAGCKQQPKIPAAGRLHHLEGSSTASSLRKQHLPLDTQQTSPAISKWGWDDSQLSSAVRAMTRPQPTAKGHIIVAGSWELVAGRLIGPLGSLPLRDEWPAAWL